MTTLEERFKAAARKRAQRTVPATSCPLCGSTEMVERHHPDIISQPDLVAVMCRSCHAETHVSRGDWGPGQVPQANCLVCGFTFQPKRRRRSKICSAPECRAEMGRRSARVRWGAG